MSCYIQRQLESTTEYYKITEDGPYNAVFNGFIWNLKFTAITLLAAFIAWSEHIPLLRKVQKVIFGRGDAATEHGRSSDKASKSASWSVALKKWFFFDKEFLVKAVGETGYEYLTFQRCVAAYQAVLALVSLAIMLPIHLGAGDRFEAAQFASTTLVSLSSEQRNYTYVHVIGSFLLLPFTLITMRVFFRKTGQLRIGCEFKMRRTLYLTGLPKRLRSPDAITKYFGRRYPECTIEGITLNIKTYSISNLEDELSLLQDIIREAEKSDNSRLFPNCRFCACLVQHSTPPPLAVDFYGEKKSRVETELKREAREMFSEDNKLDSAFVRMEQLEDARQIGNTS